VPRALLLAALVLAAVAPAPAATPAAGELDLLVRSSHGAGTSQTVRLRCGEITRATGYLRSRGVQRSCRAARRLAAFLAQRPDPARQCTQVYGGPDAATIGGTIAGRRISRRFSRGNGCAIADWDRAQALLPKPVGARRPVATP
jgi:hypothetical protein